MCGIAGFTRLSGVWDREAAGRIIEAIRHRGPDQQGIYEGSEVTLCAVRLKIIDLAGGDQPIMSDDGDTVIVFNGEIYNHREIRRELERLGHRFRSQCDTETLLRAFMEWDTACFERMRGKRPRPPAIAYRKPPARGITVPLRHVISTESPCELDPNLHRAKVPSPSSPRGGR